MNLKAQNKIKIKIENTYANSADLLMQNTVNNKKRWNFPPR